MADASRFNLFQLTHGACRRLPGPCNYAICRFNLTAETRDTRGAKPTRLNAPILRESCVLEAAEQGGMTLEEIASRFALTRERVRQIELSALRKLGRQLQRDAWVNEGPAESPNHEARAESPRPPASKAA
jgi:hypothetical protein